MSDEENGGIINHRRDYNRRVPVAALPLPKFNGFTTIPSPPLPVSSAHQAVPSATLSESVVFTIGSGLV